MAGSWFRTSWILKGEGENPMKNEVKIGIYLLLIGAAILLLTVTMFIPYLNSHPMKVSSAIYPLSFAGVVCLLNLIGYMSYKFTNSLPRVEENHGKGALSWIRNILLLGGLQTISLLYGFFPIAPFQGGSVEIYITSLIIVGANSVGVYLLFKQEIKSYFSGERSRRHLVKAKQSEEHDLNNRKWN